MVNIKPILNRLWNHSPSLTGLSLLMLGVLLANLAGLVFDRRIITGAPAWLKPAKFAISTALYSGTLAWMLGYLTVHRRQGRIAGGTVAAMLFIEIALIDFQAARGTTSHFDVKTPFDQGIWTVMAVSILILLLASIWIVVLLFRQRFAVPALGWAIRFGLLISVLGATIGGRMAQPTPAQKQQFGRSPVTAVGAHTVGAPDGGPGLPITNWSRQHGDLRIPHFLGLHGAQVIPLLYFLFLRRKAYATPGVWAAAGSYLALTALLFWQASRGQSIIEPDGLTAWTSAGWFAASVSAMLLAVYRSDRLPLAAATQLV